ncbi:MAG: protein phosphatase CheZ [bacterium]
MAAPNDAKVDTQTDYSLLPGKYLVFHLADVQYGLEIARVHEIVQVMKVTKIPNAPDYVRGIINLRGRTMPAFDLRVKFDLEAAENTDKTCIIIVEVPTPEGTINAGVVVDAVAEVLELEEKHLSRPPEVGMGRSGAVLKGVGVVNGQVTMLLDMAKVLTAHDLALNSAGPAADPINQPESQPAESQPAESQPAESHGILGNLTEILERLEEGSHEHQVASGLLSKMQKFLQVMREGEAHNLDHLLEEFDMSEQPLLRELGKLVRKLHAGIKKAGSDVPLRLEEIAENELVGATQRLEHLVEMTERAANTTLGLAEGMMQTLTEQEAAHKSVLEKMEQQLASGEPPAAELLGEALEVLQSKAETERALQKPLTEILLAQSYQDLTGQVAQKIATLLGELEVELLDLVKTFGVDRTDKKEQPGEMALQGPLSEKSEVKKNQDEVDSLLDSLGF